MHNIHIFSDFDGTITSLDTLVFLAVNIGAGSKKVEEIGREIREHRMSLRDGIAEEMCSIRSPFDEAVSLLLKHVKIDDGFPRFADWCRQSDIPLTILSAGFHQLIELFITREQFPEIEVLANEIVPDENTGWQCIFRDDTPYGHDKAAALKQARDEGKYIIFIGDGLSDRAAAEAADEVFAKHSLIEHCRNMNIFCHEFDGFDDILLELQGREDLVLIGHQ